MGFWRERVCWLGRWNEKGSLVWFERYRWVGLRERERGKGKWAEG